MQRCRSRWKGGESRFGSPWERPSTAGRAHPGTPGSRYSVDVGSGAINNQYGHGYLSSCRLVKTGRTATGEKGGLYAYEWVNPHPEKKIISIEMVPIGALRDWIWKQVDAQRVALVALSAVQ